MLDLKYITLKSRIYKKSKIFKGKKVYLNESKQLIKYVIGTYQQVQKVDSKFFKEIESEINYLNKNKKEPIYFCEGYLIYEHSLIVKNGNELAYPIVIDL